MKKLRWIGTIVLVVIFLSTAGFIIWGSIPAAPMAEALDALITNETVLVENEEWIVFSPRRLTAETGLIFYPGGRVDPRAYAPLLHQVAEAGYLAVIIPMPLNLAVFSPNKAAEVITTFPEIESWAVGGHSLGGAMAARFAYQNPDMVQGLVLLAAYPANSDNLSGSGLDVVSIYGNLDGLATPEKIQASEVLLPSDTTWVAITGGNHAQFGWYGDQQGDNAAQISRQEQQDKIVEATLALLKDLQ